MTYKDKDKQKTAQRERTRRYRAKQKGVTSKGVTQGVTPEHPQTAPFTQNTDEQEDGQGTKPDEVMLQQPTATEVKFRQALGPPSMSNLPSEPTYPTGEPNLETAKLTARQLKTRLSLYHGLDWINSPEYAETIYRLLTWTLDALKDAGQSIPAWRQNAA